MYAPYELTSGSNFVTVRAVLSFFFSLKAIDRFYFFAAMLYSGGENLIYVFAVSVEVKRGTVGTINKRCKHSDLTGYNKRGA